VVTAAVAAVPMAAVAEASIAAEDRIAAVAENPVVAPMRARDLMAEAVTAEARDLKRGAV